VRLLIGGLVLALCLACGESSPSGSVGGGQATVRITATGDGLVRGMGTDCRGSCTATVAKGTQLRLEAVPDSGATFAGWSDACTGAGACQISVDGDLSVSATFSRPPPSRRLTVVVDGQGRVVSSPAGIDCTSSTCSAVFAEGTAVSLSATSAASTKFNGWGGNCTGADACSITLQSDAQVFARFEPLQIGLSATVSGPGQVTGGGLSCGNGASACNVTLAPGTAVTLTAAAAPNARFMGWAGACSGTGATCQLAPQTAASVIASFQFELQTLVANDGRNIWSLALNSTHVFFGRNGTDGYALWAVPKSGGEQVRLAAGVANFIVADDAFVYWTDYSGGLYSAPVDGGSGSLLATGNIGRLALDDEGALYWVSVRSYYDSSDTGAIHRMQNRVDAVIASGQNQNLAVAVDSTHAYFTCASFNGSDRSIRRVSKKGGKVELVTATSFDPVAVRVDSRNVYYRDAFGAVWAVGKPGGTPRLLSAANGSSGWFHTELEANSFVVWWVWLDGSTGPKGVFRANADGTGWAGVDTSTDYNWSTLRVDDTAAYYFHAGALLKRLK
jgi:List-Bact-rpt repeat protein